MKERPILFNSKMVRAILTGRKTQTRRPVTNGAPYWHNGELMFSEKCKGGYGPSRAISWCPFGRSGDRLWVRETTTTTKGNGITTIYRADYVEDDSGERVGGWIGDRFIHGKPTWCPSIHMPRRASRISLEITGTRVEHLHDLKTADACAEGFDNQTAFLNSFASIYEAKHGRNPWVWVVEFKRVDVPGRPSLNVSEQG